MIHYYEWNTLPSAVSLVQFCRTNRYAIRSQDHRIKLIPAFNINLFAPHLSWTGGIKSDYCTAMCSHDIFSFRVNCLRRRLGCATVQRSKKSYRLDAPDGVFSSSSCAKGRRFDPRKCLFGNTIVLPSSVFICTTSENPTVQL